MRTHLNAKALLPTTHPYNTNPWHYPGAEALPASDANANNRPDFFDNHPEIVDWLLVELRSGTDAATTLARRAALLRDDGAVVDLDGVSAVRFADVPVGSYYVVVRHRNHLAVMSASAVDFTTGEGAHDFTAGPGYGLQAMKQVAPGAYGLWAGDADGDGQVVATDYQLFWRVQNGGPDGYRSADFDLSGNVIASDYQLYWRLNNSVESRVP